MLDKNIQVFMLAAKDKRQDMKEKKVIDYENRTVIEDFEDYLFSLYVLGDIRLYTYRYYEDSNGKVDSLTLTLTCKGKKEKRIFNVWEKNVIDQVCDFIENFIIAKMYTEAAETNVVVLNGIMAELNNSKREISYVVDDSGKDLAALENNKVVFIVAPQNAINFASTWLARKSELEQQGEIHFGIEMEIDRELNQLKSLYEEETIVDVLYKRIAVHKLLGVKVLSKVPSLIKKTYRASKDGKDGYVIEGDFIKVIRNGEVVFNYNTETSSLAG